MPSERFVPPEPSDEAMEAVRRTWAANPRTQVRAAYAVDLPGIVRAELLRFAAYAERTENDHIDRGQPMDWSLCLDNYLRTRFDAPSAEGERCGMCNGTGSITLVNPERTLTAPCIECVGTTPPPPSAAKDCGFCADKEPHRAEDCSYGRGLPLKEPPGVSPPSATGERNATCKHGLVVCFECNFGAPTQRLCTACGCAACRADRAFVRVLASAYVNFPGLAPDTPTQVAARAVTEAR